MESCHWPRTLKGKKQPLATGFRSAAGLEMFKSRVHVILHAAADLNQIAQENLGWLDKQIAGRKYVCGDRVTLADIMLFAFLEFGKDVGQPLNPALKNVSALHSNMKARSSAAA